MKEQPDAARELLQKQVTQVTETLDSYRVELDRLNANLVAAHKTGANHKECLESLRADIEDLSALVNAQTVAFKAMRTIVLDLHGRVFGPDSPPAGPRRVEYICRRHFPLPVMLHSVTAIFPVFPFNLNCSNTMFSAHIISHGLSMVANLLSMMETGVPARYPKLRIGFS